MLQILYGRFELVPIRGVHEYTQGSFVWIVGAEMMAVRKVVGNGGHSRRGCLLFWVEGWNILENI